MGGKVSVSFLKKKGFLETPLGIIKKGSLPKSVAFLGKGSTLEIFIAGTSSQKSQESKIKQSKEGMSVNDKHILKKQEIVDQAKLWGAKAAVIFGPDPLTKIDRCVSTIALLKKAYGGDFHIHLKTPLKLVTPQRLERLFTAGLDEIRIQLDPNSTEDLQKLRYLGKYKEVGAEIDAYPNKIRKTKQLLDIIDGKVKFLIINELIKSDDNENQLKNLKVDNEGVVKESQEVAYQYLAHIAKSNLNIHYTPASLNTKIEKQKMKAKAKNIVKKYEKLTRKGTIVHGVIYLPDIIPSDDYYIKLQTINKKIIVKKLFRIKRDLQRELNIQFDLVHVDEAKLRLTTSPEIVNSHAPFLKNMKLKPAVVEEYPSQNEDELQVEFL